MFATSLVYFDFLKFYFFCTFFIIVLFVLCIVFVPFLTLENKSLLKVKHTVNRNKKSAYECGFEPFNDSRGSFEVHFHITAIMFLLFDIEVAYLLPWLLNLKNLGIFGQLTGFYFILLLLLGFIYELKRGALTWPRDES